tara:strand:+ start:186 stop:467 length:282 start_codon:yes stop_codon:yes gene_type:complete
LLYIRHGGRWNTHGAGEARSETKEIEMALDRIILAFAGFMVLLSVALGVYVSPYWFFLTVFVGLNLIQSSFTGFCPAAIIFKKLGVKPGCAFN